MQLEQELMESKKKLKELVASQSKANCSSKYSSGIDVRREEEIEEMEDKIKRLENQLKKGV